MGESQICDGVRYRFALLYGDVGGVDPLQGRGYKSRGLTVVRQQGILWISIMYTAAQRQYGRHSTSLIPAFFSPFGSLSYVISLPPAVSIPPYPHQF